MKINLKLSSRVLTINVISLVLILVVGFQVDSQFDEVSNNLRELADLHTLSNDFDKNQDEILKAHDSLQSSFAPFIFFIADPGVTPTEEELIRKKEDFLKESKVFLGGFSSGLNKSLGRLKEPRNS